MDYISTEQIETILREQFSYEETETLYEAMDSLLDIKIEVLEELAEDKKYTFPENYIESQIKLYEDIKERYKELTEEIDRRIDAAIEEVKHVATVNLIENELLVKQFMERR